MIDKTEGKENPETSDSVGSPSSYSIESSNGEFEGDSSVRSESDESEGITGAEVDAAGTDEEVAEIAEEKPQDAEQTAATASVPAEDSLETAADIAASPPATTAKSSSKLAVFACLLALIAVGLSGYLGWTLLQQRDTDRTRAQLLEQQQTQVQQLQAALGRNQSSLEKQLGQRDRQISQLNASLAEAELSIDAHSRRMLALTATTTDDWRLAEVEYLLRLANQRLLTSKDGKTALQLLQASDAILLELADPRLFKVRKAIANDRAAIAAIGEYDLEGVFLELAALSGQVSDLQMLVMPEFTPEQAPQAAAEKTAEALPAWLEKIAGIGRSTWAELKSLVVIQSVDEPVKPLLPPDQQIYLKSNLRLMISQAQLALLDGKQQTYTQSLGNAANWLQEYFPPEHPGNSAMTEALQRLAGVQVSQEFPDVSESLLAIKAFITEQHRMAEGGKKGNVPEKKAPVNKTGQSVSEKEKGNGEV